MSKKGQRSKRMKLGISEAGNTRNANEDNLCGDEIGEIAFGKIIIFFVNLSRISSI